MLNKPTKIEILSYKILYLFSLLIFCLFILINKIEKRYILEFRIIEYNRISIRFPLLVDSISLSFRCVILFIRGSVVFFSHYYIREEKFINRFSSLILLFILSINFLIFIPNFITLLIGWDGLGIVSFLLVIFYQNSKSLRSGMVTFLSNRIGDALLIISIGWLFSLGSWNIFFIDNFHKLIVVIWCVTIASITKRAQIPFSAWLPAAIAAPTPVSALVHSSTLVTAGVFLLIRFYDQVFSNSELNWFVLNIRTLTTLIAGIRAVCETDIKKIIALSTLRQLGVIIFSLSLGIKELCVFHLFTHALFKALLFMCAGRIIHNYHHLQDIRKLGLSWYYMPISSSCLNIANLSLCGFPYLSGFYSKDLILESMLSRNIIVLELILIVVATLLTTLYSVRLTFFRLIVKNNYFSIRRKNEESSHNVLPIVAIRVISVLRGPALSWLINCEIREPFVLPSEKAVPIILILIGLAIGFETQILRFGTKYKKKIFFGSSNIWFIASLTSQPTIANFFFISENNIKIVDQGWNEIAGGQGLYEGSSFIFLKLRELQFNKTNTFISIIIINRIVLCFYF